MITIKRILYPTDFSDLASHAVGYTCSFAEAFNSEIHLLHVVDEAYQYWMAMGPNSLPVGPSPDDMLRSAQEQMSRWKTERFAAAKPSVKAAVVVGRPFYEIIAYAKRNAIDLIIMGTHGRGGLTHVLMGSVTEKVVRKSPCPVLTVRSPAHKFEMP